MLVSFSVRYCFDVERRSFRKDGLTINDNSHTKGGVVMATHTSHPPAPGNNKKYASTDQRPSWGWWYGIIYGALAGVIGMAASAWPIVFVALLMLGAAILWFLHCYGRANGVQLLADLPARNGLKVALWIAVVGLIAGLISWGFSALTGLTPLVGLMTWLASWTGALAPLLAFVLLGLASTALLWATAYGATRATIVCLVALGIVVVFMAQQSVTSTETPFEKLKETCTSQQADEFPADCR